MVDAMTTIRILALGLVMLAISLALVYGAVEAIP
jgi:hypothetical protein